MYKSKSNANLLSLSIALLSVVILFAIPISTATSQGSVTPSDSANRFQVSAFAYPASEQLNQPMYGAYIIDTVTGKVWITLKTKAPQEIGKVD